MLHASLYEQGRELAAPRARKISEKGTLPSLLCKPHKENSGGGITSLAKRFYPRIREEEDKGVYRVKVKVILRSGLDWTFQGNRFQRTLGQIEYSIVSHIVRLHRLIWKFLLRENEVRLLLC